MGMRKQFALLTALITVLVAGVFFEPRQSARAEGSSVHSSTKQKKKAKATRTPTPKVKKPTPTRTSTPTKTATPTRTFTPTRTPTFTKTPTVTRTFTATPGIKKSDLPPLFLGEAKGEVYVVHHGDKKKADPPQKIEADDRILTGKDSKAYLVFREGGTIEVGPESDLKISQLDIKDDSFKAKFLMAFGKMKTAIHRLTSPSSSFEIEAGGVISGVRGTTFEVAYDKDKKQEATKTYEGTVYTRANGKETLVKKGFSLVVGQGSAPVLGPLSGSDIADFVDFLDASDKLDKLKDILLKKLEQRLLDEAAKQLLGGAGNGAGNLLHLHF
jgi:hypothetical protein